MQMSLGRSKVSVEEELAQSPPGNLEIGVRIIRGV